MSGEIRRTVNGKHSYRFVTHIFHVIVYRDGEILAILPKDYKAGWGRISAEVIFDVIDDDMFGEAPF